MPKKAIKDVVGIIKRITQPKDKEYPKKDGTKFTIWSVGIQLDNDEWYNAKAGKEENVRSMMFCKEKERDYAVGDAIKMYLEQEDDAGKYWKIVTISPIGVPGEEMIGDPVAESEKILAEADKEPSPTTTEATPTPEPKKDMAKVVNFKEQEADKYELGMAKNNSAIIFSHMMEGLNLSVEGKKDFIKNGLDYYDKLVITLFKRGKKQRKVILGY